MPHAQYELTEEDLLQFYMYHSNHSETHRKARRTHRRRVFIVYLMAVLLFSFAHRYVLAVLFLLIAVGWLLLAPFWQRRHYRKHFQRSIKGNRGELLNKPMTIETRDGGVFTTSYSGEATFRYAAIDRIAEDNGYTYIFVGKENAIILPHDRIPSETILSIVREIDQRRKEAVGTVEA